MTTNSSSPTPDAEPVETNASQADPSATSHAPLTRAGAAWVATSVALLLLICLIVFILENSSKVEVQFLGMSGTIPLGMALLIAAVGGGVVVAIAGVARVTQLRRNARHTRHSPSSP
ncbi:lipopolysaccharide assembly protein LapA domain-containing protein [Nocardioides jishulii]|uniref:DUF1049 domain-containing protein n=1 Tax=Nocardioides jishulii TaxID=2575440 RepID=A0A4U2YMK1_9ACTN|nr:lipopolysaccharide assembly protein LapA domain-containing protein [Nocardioides jishulii]QCX27682.1 DUF1049 domain-containing protein [Nocardioides jishulii]TKI62489.1 DUF1049 domain-containing protein [Nocardioides jishulii]